MQGEASSALLGTSGLALGLIVALTLASSRPGVAAEHRLRVRRIASLAVVLQAGHFGEEYLQQFYLRFPALLGIAPWSKGFFVTFNFVWLAVWVLAIASLGKFARVAAFPLWFLAIASAANGVAHPLLSLAVAGYFPGLWSSPLVGLLGVVLLRALADATSARGSFQDVA
jgi:hypothetical protein